MVDFGALPPEINSARMYAGPGSASLVAAAQMWDSVASDLFSAASAFQSVVWGLTVGSWIGSSALGADVVRAPTTTVGGTPIGGMPVGHAAGGHRGSHGKSEQAATVRVVDDRR